MNQIRWLILCLILLPIQTIADDDTGYSPLDEALVIVFRNSKEIKGKQELAGIAQNQKGSTWNVKGAVRSGYSQKSTDEFATGIDNRAAITFTWTPNFGYANKDDKAKAQARTNHLLAVDKIRNNFIADMQSLSMFDVKLTIENRTHTIAVQKLKRVESFNAKVKKEGRNDMVQPIDDTALAVLNQQQIVKLAEHELNSQVRTIAVKWGFNEWQKLEWLIARYIKSMRGLSLVQYNN
ncbi:hypothetical protein QUF74_05475 [Candidatus Halobeggiatoa sp. HSG11]|nr:hypothetical protein [Candidatus Halobeggiatoa sp. HSG11]